MAHKTLGVVVRLTLVGAAALGVAACAYEIGYRSEYVPAEAPAFVAHGRLLIVMPQEQREFLYTGPPSSTTGDFTTLTVPIGAIVQDIAKQVFGRCFALGVDFVDTREGQSDYVLALEGDMQQLAYSYTKVIDQGFGDEPGLTWIVPELDISFAVKAYNRAGEIVLDRIYDSGVVAGESYLVTRQPAERINRTLHTTLHGLMLELAEDVRPLLECPVEDAPAQR